MIDRISTIITCIQNITVHVMFMINKNTSLFKCSVNWGAGQKTASGKIREECSERKQKNACGQPL